MNTWLNLRRVPTLYHFLQHVFKERQTSSSQALLFEWQDPFVLGVVSKMFVGFHECEQNACGECPNCLEVWEDRLDDQLVIFPEGAQYKVAEVKPMQEFIQYSALSSRAKRRYILLNEVDRLNIRSANLLLKTIEEPPEQGLIMMTTSRYGAVLPTIKSRVSRFRLPKLNLAELRSLVEGWPQYEKLLNHADRDQIHDYCDGDLGLMQLLATGERLKFLKAFSALGSQAKASEWLSFAHKLSNEFEGTSLELLNYLELCLNYCYKRDPSALVAKGHSKRRKILLELRQEFRTQLTSFNQQLILEGVLLAPFGSTYFGSTYFGST